MLDRDRGRTARRPTRRPQAEALETRQLLVASLSPIGPLSVPQGLGFQLPLEGGAGRPQTYAVASDNPALRATVARGQFLTLGVTHASSGRAGDPTFNGTLTLQLFEDLTPLTAARIEQLVTQGFYTSPTTNPNPSELPGGVNLPSKNFHRVVPGFVVQAGSPTGTGTGNVNQPGFPFPDEFVQQLAFTGTGQLAMANAGDDTNSSQFFITTSSPRNLDFNHTIFGQLVADPQGILPQMEAVARDVPPNSTEQSRPVSPILITSATLSPVSPDGVVHIDTTTATAGQAATITVTATDPADGTTAVQSFPVTVAADPTNDRPFLGPIGDQVVGFARSVTFRVPVVNREPGDQLNFIVRGGINSATGQFTDVQNATVSINQTTGDVTVTPRANFPGGPITLLVGVRDQVDRSGQNNLEAVSNYDTQSITLTVTANTRPIAQSFPASTLSNAPVTIQLVGTDTDVNQTLTYELVSPPGNGSVTNFNAQTGTLTYTPRANFIGTDRFTYRVLDAGEPSPSLASEPATVTIAVTPGTIINVAPTAQASSVAVTANTPVPVQLVGNTGNPESGQTLTYAIVTNPTNGTISDFDPQRGTFTYTPATNFIGTDTLTFRVTDVGLPTPNLESAPATVTFTVTGAVPTGAVRQIGRVLVVTPLPRTEPDAANIIQVAFVNNQIAVSVNGAVDTLRPAASDLDRIVVYGAKINDQISVAPDVPLQVTLDGGHGGRNRLQANDIDARLHGWFGSNTLTGGAGDDALIGRRGHVQFVRSGGKDLLFAGEPRGGAIVPPTGTFFRFVKNRLVALPTPAPRPAFQSTPASRHRDLLRFQRRLRNPQAPTDSTPATVVGQAHPTPPRAAAKKPASARAPRRDGSSRA